MKYSHEKNALVVSINKCTNVPARDSADNSRLENRCEIINIQVSSDPYIKLQILPEKEHKVKTRVLRNTVNPVYDEDFTFYGVHFNRLQVFLLHTEYIN